MDVYIIQLKKKRKSMLIDATNWDSVPLKMRHLLIVEGSLDFLTRQFVDLDKYVKDLADLYIDVLKKLKESDEIFAPSRKCVGRIASVLYTDNVDISVLISIKTTLEKVIKFISENPETYGGRVIVSVKEGRVYIGGIYSPGHTYLYSLGFLKL
ncbi:MAG: hypothetical protein QW792_03995 [Pyrobaculum sp.]